MLNQYETVFICTPVLSEPQVKETVKKFKEHHHRQTEERCSMKKTGE